MPLSFHEEFYPCLQHGADNGDSVEAVIMRHERQTWELIDVLFSEIQAEVGSRGTSSTFCIDKSLPDYRHRLSCSREHLQAWCACIL